MYKKIVELNQYIKWLFKKYQALQLQVQNTCAYKILDITYTKDGVCKIKFYIAGTGKTVQLTPEEIALDDNLLEGFSKKDVRTVTYYACEERAKPQHQIIAHTFSDKLKKTIFSIKKRTSQEIVEQTAEDISLNRDAIKKLSPQDAHRAGYLYGMEETDKEQALMENTDL